MLAVNICNIWAVWLIWLWVECGAVWCSVVQCVAIPSVFPFHCPEGTSRQTLLKTKTHLSRTMSGYVKDTQMCLVAINWCNG